MVITKKLSFQRTIIIRVLRASCVTRNEPASWIILRILDVHTSRGNATRECEISQSPLSRAHICFRVDAADLILLLQEGDTRYTARVYYIVIRSRYRTYADSQRETNGGGRFARIRS